MLPSGPISTNNQLLVDRVAASSTFRNRINPTAPSDAEARLHIHWPHLDVIDESGAEVEIKRPLAVVQSGPLNYTKYAGGALNSLKPAGSAILILEDDDRFPDEANDKNGQIDFENFIGNVIKEIAAAAGQGDDLATTGIRQILLASVVHPRERASRGKFWRSVFQFDWGWV